MKISEAIHILSSAHTEYGDITLGLVTKIGRGFTIDLGVRMTVVTSTDHKEFGHLLGIFNPECLASIPEKQEPQLKLVKNDVSDT